TYLENMHQFIKQDQQWQIIDYTERQSAIEKMYEHIIQRLEQAIAKHHAQDNERDGDFTEHFSTNMFDIEVDKVSKEAYKSLINELQKRM
ncbi:phosphate--AMP phosphotransferase, partial [Staphylococcus aureus]|nr:phosphate--AMP phosphotransferase [Staphylococcus aureus]